MNRRAAFSALAVGLTLCSNPRCYGQGNVVASAKPVKLPDLVVTSLSARMIAPNKVQCSWTVTNAGRAPARFEGPTASAADNVKIQAFISKDTVFGNAGDVAAGGASPLGELAPHASRSGTFTATVPTNLSHLPHLVVKVDSANTARELNENNNTKAVRITR